MKVRISMRPSEFKDFVGLLRTMLGLEVECPRDIILGVINCETLEKMLAKHTLQLLAPLKKKTVVTFNELEIIAFATADDKFLFSLSNYDVTYLEIIELINKEHLRLKNYRENMKGNMRMQMRE
ncbi:MAG: hypothetical protein H6Q15_2091 [Bacteroidetes bacterium]|nr:hypothetical protein [Bacteroidota bacterium]